MEPIDIVLDQMRQGGTVTRGSSRCHTDYGYDPEGFYAEHFDEGYIERRRTTEDAIRSLFERDPSEFAGLLRRHGWRLVRAALDAEDEPAACEALRWIQATCDHQQHADVWLAALDPTPPDEATAEMVRAKSRSSVLWHAIMEQFEWRYTAKNGARASWLLNRLVERITGIRDQAKLHARFAAMNEPER